MTKDEYYEKSIVALEAHAKKSNEEMGIVQVDIAEIKNDVSWLKRFFWIIATSSIGGLISGLLNLLWR